MLLKPMLVHDTWPRFCLAQIQSRRQPNFQSVYSYRGPQLRPAADPQRDSIYKQCARKNQWARSRSAADPQRDSIYKQWARKNQWARCRSAADPQRNTLYKPWARKNQWARSRSATKHYINSGPARINGPAADPQQIRNGRDSIYKQ